MSNYSSKNPSTLVDLFLDAKWNEANESKIVSAVCQFLLFIIIRALKLYTDQSMLFFMHISKVMTISGVELKQQVFGPTMK